MKNKNLKKRTQKLKNLIDNSSSDASINVPTKNLQKDEAIIKQFHRIQKEYARLMVEVLKELNLLKKWIENEAANRRNLIRSRVGVKT